MLAGKLASRFEHVTGIDANAGMASAARARLARDSRVTIRQVGFEEFAEAGGDGDGPADLITMVAVLHHLDLDDTLARIPALLAPGGRLLVVGLAKVDSRRTWRSIWPRRWPIPSWECSSILVAPARRTTLPQDSRPCR